MCWSEFLCLIAIAIVVVLVILFLFNVVFVHSAYFFIGLGQKLCRLITWPVRALWRIIAPPKKKQHRFHYEDDDIDIRF